MSNQSTIEILYVEGDSQSGQALKGRLAIYPDFKLVAEANTSLEALEKLRDKQFDLALIELSEHDANSIDLIKLIRQLRPNVRVVIVTASDSPDDIFAALDAGADAYVLKGTHSDALGMAIRTARLGTVWLDPGIAKAILDSMDSTSTGKKLTRVLPTGLLTIPLLPEEESVLNDVAGSSCKDGVCMVDLDFIKKLRRLSPSGRHEVLGT